MFGFLVLLLVAEATCLGTVAYVVRCFTKSPHGYEDASGFHFGPEKPRGSDSDPAGPSEPLPLRRADNLADS